GGKPGRPGQKGGVAWGCRLSCIIGAKGGTVYASFKPAEFQASRSRHGSTAPSSDPDPLQRRTRDPVDYRLQASLRPSLHAAAMRFRASAAPPGIFLAAAA